MSDFKDKGQLPVAEAFRGAAKLFEERGKQNGNNYWQCAQIMLILFRAGIKLETEEDFVRYQFLEHCVNKLTRYANNFKLGGHEDSSKDAAVYWMMQHEADEIFAAERADAETRAEQQKGNKRK